jgi:hypothetical protein
MSEWRRKAMATFPDRAGTLSRATSIHDLWFTLLQDLQAAYRSVPPDSDLLERIWQFAAWCFNPKRDKAVQGAVAVSFYEHLPHFGPARRELPDRLTRLAFDRLLPAFKVTLTTEELAVFIREFLRAQGADAKDIRKALHAAS